MRRTPLTRSTPLRRSTSSLRRYCPLPVVSARRAVEERRYRVLRAAFLEGRPMCEWPLGCEAAANDVHHRRGRVGADLLRTEWWSPLCRHHHIRCTENPAEAIRLGISEPRIGRGTE